MTSPSTQAVARVRSTAKANATKAAAAKATEVVVQAHPKTVKPATKAAATKATTKAPAAPAKAAAAAPKAKATKVAPKLPKGFLVKYPHGSYDLAKSDDRSQGWLVICNAHGTTTKADNAKAGDALGTKAGRATWCSSCK